MTTAQAHDLNHGLKMKNRELRFVHNQQLI